MKSLDMKLRYGITIVTLLLFLLAVKSSFGQNAVNAQTQISNDGTSQSIHQDPLIDPLSPSVMASSKKDQPDEKTNVILSNGRIVKVDPEGVQSLAIPGNSATLPDKNKFDLRHKE